MSGSDKDVRVTITADSAGYTAPTKAAAGAAQQLSDKLQGVSKALGTITAAQYQAALNAANGSTAALIANIERLANSTSQVNAPLQKTQALLADDIPQAANHSATGFAGVTREVLVLGHEAMTGNYSRIPGSLLVLAERTGGLTSKIGQMAASMSSMQIVGVGAFVALGAAVAAFVVQAISAANALREVTNAAALMGRSTGEAAEGAKRVSDSLAEAGMHKADINAVNAAIARMPGTTQQLREGFAALAPMLKTAFRGEDVDKYFGELITAANGGAASVKSYLEKIDGLNDANLAGLAIAEAQNDKQAAQKILLDAMTARAAGYNAELKRRQDIIADINAKSTGEFAPLSIQQFPLMELPQSPLPEAQREDPKKVQDEEQDQKLLAPQRERMVLTEQIARLQEKVNNASGPALDNAREELKVAQAKLALSKDPGDASWAQKVAMQAKEAADAAITSAHARNETTRQANEEEIRAELAVYRAAIAEKGHTDKEYAELKATAARLDMSLQKDEMAGASAAAKQTLEIQLATLKSEQDANRDNYAKVMQIEEQKLALLRAAGAAGAKLLAEEEGIKANLIREEAVKVAAAEEVKLNARRSANAASLAAERDYLDAEVAAHTISKAQELQTLLAFSATQNAALLADYNKQLATLQGVPKAYQEMYDRLGAIQARWAADTAKLNSEVTKDMEAKWTAATTPIQTAIEGQVSGLLRGTETMRQAVTKMAGDIVISYAQMGAKTLLQIGADKAKEVLWTGTTESSKTAAAAAGAAARTGIAQSETATENNGLLIKLGRWIATELGMTTATATNASAQTAAVVTAAATQTAATDTARAVGSAAAATTGSASVMNAANVAFANTYASVSAIPYVGPVLAPPAAAAAFAAVAAYSMMSSLAVGAWNLPADMPANLHAGEMVIPANFASGLRGAMSGGGSSSAQTLNYSPKVSGGGSADLSGTMRGQSAAFKSYLWHATRNGALALPGR